jgi:hypothetical protein
VSGLTECSMLWCGLLILIYVTCRMKCESLQSTGCFFLYHAFWLVLFPGLWLANRSEMVTSDWSDFLAVHWLTMEHISILLPPDYILKKPNDFTRCVTRSLVLCVCFVGRCLSLYLFFWPLCYLFFFNIRILITPLMIFKVFFTPAVWWGPCCSSI